MRKACRNSSTKAARAGVRCRRGYGSQTCFARDSLWRAWRRSRPRARPRVWRPLCLIRQDRGAPQGPHPRAGGPRADPRTARQRSAPRPAKLRFRGAERHAMLRRERFTRRFSFGRSCAWLSRPLTTNRAGAKGCWGRKSGPSDLRVKGVYSLQKALSSLLDRCRVGTKHQLVWDAKSCERH